MDMLQPPLRTPRVFYPVIFALTPLFFLFAHNITELALFEPQISIRLILPAGLIILSTWSVLRINQLLLRSPHKAGLMTTLLAALFFGYGSFYAVLVESWGIYELFSIQAGLTFGYNKLYLVCCLLLLLPTFYGLKRSTRNFQRCTIFCNRFALVLLAISCAQIVIVEAQRLVRRGTSVTPAAAPQRSAPTATVQFPDIYYIILDAYASDDVLRAEFNYDNHDFTAYLQDKGFYVATASRSNYPFTVLSLASTLNLDYLDALTDVAGTTLNDQSIAIDLIEHNTVQRFLKAHGYTFIHFKTIFAPTARNRNADWEVDCERGVIRDRFLKLFLSITVFDPIVRRFSGSKREEIACQFSTLAEFPCTPGPRFIFAHIIAPHEPYVFDAQGNEVDKIQQTRYQGNRRFEPEGRQLYVQQLQYINLKMKELIETILSHSRTPPIIIVQADHGARIPTARHPEPLWFSILNAYYLPARNTSALYSAISPVNSFRLIFNLYFNTTYRLLPDRSYFSDIYRTPYQFIEVPPAKKTTGN